MRILVADAIDASAIGQLEQNHDVICAFKAGPEELRELIADRQAVVFRSRAQLTAELMSAAPELRLLVRAGSGTDNVDMAYVQRHELQIVRIPGPGATAVAELAFGLMLSLARQLMPANAKLHQGVWAKGELQGANLTGKVLGIVGAGNIGGRVGEMGAAWGMEVVGSVDNPTPAKAQMLAERGIRLTSLEGVLARADYLTVHAPLLEGSRYLINDETLAQMKRGAYLVHLSRGGVVDEEAVARALDSGQLAGAAFDVHEREGASFSSPLAGRPNVILTPHIGATTADAQREIGELIVQAINRHEGAGEPPPL
jgi:phosphoglycerate dehydrogenase-like enzyme